MTPRRRVCALVAAAVAADARLEDGRGTDTRGAGGSMGGDMRPDQRLDRRVVVTSAIVTVATLFVVWNLSPWSWFTDTTPTGGDMGAHVWSPAYLRDELLPNFRLTGWSPDWYAGFPAFTFYMVLPSLLIVIVNVGLDVGLGPFSTDPAFFSFIGLALAASELTRRVGLSRPRRVASVVGVSVVGLAMSGFADGERIEFGFFGWAPIEPFVYNDASVDLAVSTIVLPIAVASMVWRRAAGLGPWRSAATAGAVVLTYLVVPVPYGVAMKFVIVAGLVTLPLAAFIAGRLAGLAYPGPAMLAVMTLPFLFDRSYNIYGGNLLSTMAGEFAFSLGLTFAVLYLGVLARGLRTGGDVGLAAGLLALAGLSHLFAAFFALVATVAFLLVRPGLRALAWLAVMGPLAALLSAFWILPFFWNRSLLNDMGWGKERRYVAALWSRSGSFGDQDFLVNDPPLQVFVVLAVIGAVVCGLRRIRFGMALTITAMTIAAAFVLLPETRLWNVRILPFYYLTVFLLAGIAVAESSRAVVRLWRSGADRSGAVAGAPAAAVALVVLVALAFPLRSVPFAGTFTRDGSTRYGFETIVGVDDLGGLGDFATTQLNFGPGWLRYNFSGYENKPGTAEYTDFVATMEQVGQHFGCGQSLWEFEHERLGSYGTTMAPMLLPHWTDGCIGSMEGLYFEASATTPYHFLLQSELSASPSRAQRDLPYSPLDVDKGVEGMRMLGVRYYMAFSEEALAQARANPELEEIAASGPWVVFQLVDHELVSGLDHLPVVIDGLDVGGEEWLVPTVAQWEAGPGTPLLAADGPDGWPRGSLDDPDADVRAPDIGPASGRTAEIRALAARLPTVLERAPVDEPVAVSGVHTDNSSIAFRVDRIGEPVLVRASYFPNWDVAGAEGPYRVSPNLMAVVPTDHDVVLTYGRSGIEVFAMGLTALGIVALVVLARRPVPFAEGKIPDRVLWDLASEPEALPGRDEVLSGIRSGDLGPADLTELAARADADRQRAARTTGLASSLAGVSLILGALLDVGAERPLASIVVFGPAAIAVVVAVFGAVPTVVRAAWYRRSVVEPAMLVAEIMDAESMDPEIMDRARRSPES